MSAVLWHVTMSLDGFVAGPDHDMGWLAESVDTAELAAVSVQVRDRVGAILGGRRGYDLGRRAGLAPEFRRPFGGAWTGPVFVLTHRPPDDEDDPAYRFLDCPIGEAVAAASEAAGTRDVLLIGADVSRQALDAGLVDEITVHVAPVLLGHGVRLLDRAGPPVRLHPLGAPATAGVPTLRYRPA